MKCRACQENEAVLGQEGTEWAGLCGACRSELEKTSLGTKILITCIVAPILLVMFTLSGFRWLVQQVRGGRAG